MPGLHLILQSIPLRNSIEMTEKAPLKSIASFFSSISNLYDRAFGGRLVLRRFASILPVDLVVRASGFILLPLYVHLMPQNEFGLFTYILAVIVSWTVVLNFGMYLAQTRLYHRYEGDERAAALFTIHILVLGFLALVLIFFFASKLDFAIVQVLVSSPISYEAYRMPLFFAVGVSVFSFMLYNFFATSERIKTYQIFSLLKLFVVHGGVLFALILSEGDTVMIRIKYAYILEFILLLPFAVILVKEMKMQFKVAIAKRALAIGLPAAVAALVGFVYNFADRFVLEKFGSLADIAVYNLALTIASVIGIVFSSYQTVYLPLFLKEREVQRNIRNTRALVWKVSLSLGILGAAIFLVAIVALDLNILDEQYNDILIILPMLLVGGIMQSIGHLFTNYFVYFELMARSTIMGVILGAVSLGLNYLLVPSLHLVGTALAYFLSSAVSVGAYAFLVTRMIRKTGVTL